MMAAAGHPSTRLLRPITGSSAGEGRADPPADGLWRRLHSQTRHEPHHEGADTLALGVRPWCSRNRRSGLRHGRQQHPGGEVADGRAMTPACPRAPSARPAVFNRELRGLWTSGACPGDPTHPGP
jgi:hypothetical protein